MRLKFKMLTIKQVVSQIRSEDWFMTIDLKDTYFHISILPQHWKSLRFAFRGKAYQYWVLSFGLALSPCTFTKCVDAALAPLRLQSICILNYSRGPPEDHMPQNAPPSVPSTPTPFRCTTTGTSIVSLEPLARCLEAWLTLPSLSRWLTRTI